MLDIKFIRENIEIVKKAITQKNVSLSIDNLLEVDKKLNDKKREQQALQEKRNAHSKKIPKATPEERPQLIEEGRAIGTELDKLKPEVDQLEQELRSFLLRVPNIPLSLIHI